MKFLYGATDFPHKNGEFCIRASYEYYSVCCFSTPFLYEKDGKLLEGRAGEIIVNAPGEPVYHGPKTSEESFTNDWLRIGGEDLRSLMEKYDIPTSTRLRHNNPMLIKNVVKKARRELALKQDGYQEKIDCILTDMVIELHRAGVKNRNADTPQDRIETVREEVMQSLEKPWDLKTMATLCGYSPSRFSALYKEVCNCSPKADLLEARMRLAEQMLKYSSLSVSSIAKECGFENIYYFSKYFKLCHGVSPSEYVGNSLKQT